MAIKDNVDFSLFTNDFSFDLFSNSIRRSFSYDSYGDKKIFQAVVISQPMPLDPSEQVFFLDPKKERTAEVSKFSYRARILGADSPHKFLPNPCDPTYTADTASTNEIIALHTTFYSSGEVGVDELLPIIGSTVEVRLEKNAFSYDLTRGYHVKVVENPPVSGGSSDNCDSITAIIAAADEAISLGSMSEPQVRKYKGTAGEQEAENGNLPSAILQKSKHSNARFLVDVVEDYDKLHDAFKDKFGKDLVLTDHYRTYATQVTLKRDKGRKAATPGTSNHGWGLAFDFDHRDSTYGISGGKEGFDSDVYNWLLVNAPKYNFHNPPWAQKTGSNKEPWHFESKKKGSLYGPPIKNKTPTEVTDGETDPTKPETAET